MNHKNRVILVKAFFLLCVSSPAFSSGTSSGAFLKIPSGARATALGESFTAVIGSADSVHWNPAGTAGVESVTHALSYMLWVEETGYGSYSFVYPGILNGSLSLGVSVLSVPDTPVTLEDEFGSYAGTEGTFGAGFYKLSLGYACLIGENLAAGANLKMIHESLDTEKGSAVAIDMGLLRSGLLSGKLAAGLSIQNLGTALKINNHSSPLPLIIKVGAAYTPEFPLTGLADVIYDFDSGLGLSLGGEYRLHDMFFLRAGYRYNPSYSGEAVKGLRAGWGIAWEPLRLDYAFIPFGNLGLAHNISILYSF